MYVLELDERASVVEVALFGRFVKVGYRLIDSEFDSIKPTILVDF